jgi:hypothetical protein
VFRCWGLLSQGGEIFFDSRKMEENKGFRCASGRVLEENREAQRPNLARLEPKAADYD